MFFLATGCETKGTSTPPYKVAKVEKYGNQIKIEKYDRTVSKMKLDGKSIEEINKSIPYADLPYEQAFERGIYENRTIARNMLDLIDTTIESCDWQRGTIERASRYPDLERKYRAEYFECLRAGSAVVNNYFFRVYSKNNQVESEKKLVDEAYISWKAYYDSIYSNQPKYVTDQIVREVKSNSSRAHINIKTHKK